VKAVKKKGQGGQGRKKAEQEGENLELGLE